MRRGLEALAVVMVFAVSWISISLLQARSTATAQVSIYIPERQDAEPEAGLDPLAALPADPAPAPGMELTTTTVRRSGSPTVLHTQTPEI